MKVKIICAILLSLIYVHPSNADEFIKMVGKEKYGYNIPQYSFRDYEWRDQFNIELIGDKDNFPWTSEEQGSIFNKIFDDLANKEHIMIKIKYPWGEYEQKQEEFEKQRNEAEAPINGLMAVYYDNIPYSINEYIYPTIFENEVYLITEPNKKLEISQKADLKKYRGIYINEDYISKFVKKEMGDLGIKEVNSFSEGYKDLLTGKADFIVASYYKSQIELYKLGIRNYVAYSKNPIWKMPLFIRVKPSIANNQRINNLKKYLKSARYKEIRDKNFQELLDIYRKNTEGIVPPTYINQNKEKTNVSENI